MTKRTERIAEAIRRLASEIIRDGLRDPRLVGFVTVTEVRVTPDLRLAKIYYSVLGDAKNKVLVKKGLQSAKAYMRREFAHKLELRYAPEVSFVPDENAEHRARIETILNDLNREDEDDTSTKDSKSN